jgi:hypothetical protein
MTDHMSQAPAESDMARPLRVRPYTLTRGRTSAAARLAIETIVRATADGGYNGHGGDDLGVAVDPEVVLDSAGDDPAQLIASPEARAIMELTRQPHSIAELSAHLGLPLQVTKILVGDLVTAGLVSTTSPAVESGGRPDLLLLERVLEGLQQL